MKNKEKEVILDETKKSKKEGGKLFTKKKSNNTIRKNYNPFEVNYKIYKRRDGSYNMDKMILEEIKKDLNFKERIIVHINKKTFIKVFNKTRLEIINKYIK